MSDFRQLSFAIESALENVLDCDCAYCLARPLVPATAAKIISAWERHLVVVSSPSGEEGVKPAIEITREEVHALRILARATEPVQGVTFQFVLGLDARKVKAVMRELRDSWLLPVCATRQPPYGYFIAATLEQCNQWFNTTLSQALSEIAVAYKVRRANFPELAGQEPLEFSGAVSNQLKAAIEPPTSPSPNGRGQGEGAQHTGVAA